MKRTFTILIMTLLLIGCAGKADEKKAESKISKSEFVEVYEEPRHQLVFEKGNLKILDIQIKSGDTTLFHRHRNPMFYVSLGWQQNASQLLNAEWKESDSEEWPLGEIDIDSSYLTNSITHRVTNTGSKASQIIGILNTGKGLTISDKSNGYEVASRWFRSKRINLNPGETINFHNSVFPIVIVLLSGDEIEVVKDNKSTIHNKKWLYLEDINELINSGDNKMEMVQIEVLNSLESKASR